MGERRRLPRRVTVANADATARSLLLFVSLLLSFANNDTDLPEYCLVISFVAGVFCGAEKDEAMGRRAAEASSARRAASVFFGGAMMENFNQKGVGRSD